MQKENKMFIKITKTDCTEIVNKSKRGGGGENSDLEIALAKKCLELYAKLGAINDERTEFFESLYSVFVALDKHGETLRKKRMKDLQGTARGLTQQLEKINASNT